MKIDKMVRKAVTAIIVCCGFMAAIVTGFPFEVKSFDGLKNIGEESEYRLPKTTKPETYDISLATRVDLGIFDFDGVVQIGIVALEKTKKITLHYRQLTIESVRLTDSSDAEIKLLDYEYDVETEFMTIPTDNVDLLAHERYKLTIKYNGVLRTDNDGFYRSSYVNSEGKQIWLATTQFEATNARDAFPCYDESVLKAKFTIRITHGVNYSAVSNTPETRKQNTDGTVTTSFETTPLMSSYIVAFVVSDFNFMQNVPGSAFRYRVFANPLLVKNAQFATSEAEKLLTAISNYLQVPFPLSKMDLVAVPDFNAGAMENWGLVTYREKLILLNETQDLYSAKTQIVSVISHEFGHQWLGDLVSPKWWSYIWLNEGFATLFEQIGTNLVHPDWNIFHYFVVQKLQTVFQDDALESTHPMTNHVKTPGNGMDIFDSIAYDKSGSVIRMFLNAFTEGSFKKGLRYYLTDRAYKAADEDDLFNNLDKAVKEDKTLDKELQVKDLFGSWSNQKGFPLLKVNRNYINGSITISQEKYTADKSSNTTDQSTWWIPYNFASAKNPSFKDTSPAGWLPQATKLKLVEQNPDKKLSSDEWVVFNKQQTGYYRVLYDEKNYELLTKELTSGDLNKIHPVSRAQIIDDLNDFARSGRISHNVFFDLLKYLSKETKYAPWVSARRAINHLGKVLADSKELSNFRKFITPLVEPFYQCIGLNDADYEPHFAKYSREIATNLACEYGATSCLNETYELFVNALNTGNFASQNNRALIYKNGIRNASSTELDLLWDRLIDSTNKDERKEILTSFGYISDNGLLKHYLLRSIDVNIKIWTGERAQLVFSVARGSQEGLSLVIQLISDNIDVAKECFGRVDDLLVAIAETIVTQKSQSQFASLLAIVKSKKLFSDEFLLAIQKEVKTNLESLSVYRTEIESYVAAQYKTDSGSTMITSSVALLSLVVSLTSYFNSF